MKKKIFFVATVEVTVNAFLLNHLRYLSKSFDLTVLVSSLDSNFLRKKGLEARVVPLRISRSINILSDIRTLFFLIGFFLKNSPSAVQTITPKAGLLGMVAAFVSFVPMRVHTFTGQVWVTKNGLVRYFFRFFDWLIGLLANFCIVDSPSQCEFLINEKVITEKKSIVFGLGSVSGVNLKKFKANKATFKDVRLQLDIPLDAFVFIYLGRLNKDKGILDLAEAFSRIQNPNVYLLVVGPDEGGFAKKIKLMNFAKQNNIRLIPFTNTPECFLSASDALSLPSYREGFGSVIIEAAAMGIPAIGSRIYGLSDAIVNNFTGLLHEPKDVNSILACLEFFIDNPVLVKEFGTNARARAVKEFDADCISQHWLDFYKQNIQ